MLIGHSDSNESEDKAMTVSFAAIDRDRKLIKIRSPSTTTTGRTSTLVVLPSVSVLASMLHESCIFLSLI
jgi:hypothetical protein